MNPGIRAATPGDWPAIRGLLAEAGLPVSDLDGGDGFLVCEEGGCLVGAVAIQFLDDGAAMLRSLVVRPESRSIGVGNALVDEAEARARGAAGLYLLTDSAQAFFRRRGYLAMERHAAPATVRDHPQFATLCPTSATLMHRRINP